MLAVSSVGTVRAAAGPGLSIGVPPRVLAVGDRLPVRITARGGSGLLWDTPKVKTSGLEDRWAVVQEPRAIPQTQPPVWEMVLVPLMTGTLTLPAVSVSVRDRQGSVSTVTADALPKVKVASVLPPGGKVAPAPLDDPAGVTGFPWEWIPPALVVLVPFLLVAAFLWWRRHERRRTARAEGEQLPPLEELRGVLGRITDQIGSRPLDEICDQLSSALRRFVERRTGTPAVEMTTFELVRFARRSGWPAAVQHGLHEALRLSDSVRFARKQTAESVVRATVRHVEEAACELDTVLTRFEAEPGTEGAL